VRTFAEVSTPEQRRAICARIKQARVEAGFTQEEMADNLYVRPRTYQNYERDRVPWRLLDQIAKLTKREQAWFLHGDEGPDLSAVLARIETAVQKTRDELHEIRDRVDQVIESAADEALLPSLDDAPPPPTGEAPGEGETPAAESG